MQQFVGRIVRGARHNRRMEMGQRGFTLLELLMVVIIIGIMASVALPQGVRMMERQRAGEAMRILGSIRSAQHRLAEINENPGTYVTNILKLDTGVPFPMKYWTFGAAAANNTLTFIKFERTGSVPVTHLGLQYGNGAFCGNFTQAQPDDPTCT